MYDFFAYTRIRLMALPRTDRGASAVEYGLLVALIAVVIIVGVSALGGKLKSVFTNTSSKIAS